MNGRLTFCEETNVTSIFINENNFFTIKDNIANALSIHLCTSCNVSYVGQTYRYLEEHFQTTSSHIYPFTMLPKQLVMSHAFRCMRCMRWSGWCVCVCVCVCVGGGGVLACACGWVCVCAITLR